MKKLVTGALALFSALTFGATLGPVQLLNPTGSTAGQAIVSTGAATAPAWGTVSAAALAGILPIANGGTNAGAASGTALDNITGFAGTGFLKRTGAGAYSFIADPLPIANGGTGQTSASAALTALGGATVAQATSAVAISGGTINGTTIGGTTPGAGTFTTLKGNSLAKVFATKTSALSLTNNAATTIVSWTTTYDVNSNFNAATGTFTAPATGYYVVSVQVVTATAAIAAGSVASLTIVANGSSAAIGETTYAAASGANTPITVQTTALVSLASGQTLTVQAFQNSGGAVNTTTNPNATYISIAQIP